MRRLNDLNSFAGRAIAVTRDYNTFQRRFLILMPLCPCPLECSRHLRRAFACTNHNRSAFGLCRQIGADHQFRVSSSNRCIKETGQKLLRIGDGGHEIPDIIVVWPTISERTYKINGAGHLLQTASSMFSPPEKSGA